MLVNYTVLIPAAGSGQRMGAGRNKLFLELAGKPILIHTLEVFQQDPACESIILAVKPTEQNDIEQLLEAYAIHKVACLVPGGAERQHSVAACLHAHHREGIVLVHDAARPFIRQNIIHELVRVAAAEGAAVAGVRAKDTMKLAKQGVIEGTVDRDQLWAIQTPQAFHWSLLQKACERAIEDGFIGTDESTLVERLGHPVHIVESTYDNVKMTTKDDLVFGEILLKRRLGGLA